MTLEEKLYSRLSADAGVTALVSTRIYPLDAPQDAAMPYVVYQRISSGRVYALDGYSSLENPLIQIDVWADTYPAAKAVMDAVTASMRGATTFGTAGDEPRESFEDLSFRVSNDFTIWNQEG